MPVAIVMRVVMVPLLLEPRSFQPPTSIASVPLLKISTNSSLAPFGPRVRNSLMTIAAGALGDGEGLGELFGVGVGLGLGEGVAVGNGVGVGVGLRLGLGLGLGLGVGVGVGVAVGVGAGVGLGTGVGVGDGLGLTIVTVASSDSIPRAVAVIATVPGEIALANPVPSICKISGLFECQPKITSCNAADEMSRATAENCRVPPIVN